MKSLATLSRKRTAALREIADQLRQLRPLAPKMGLNDDDSASLEEILKRMKGLPEFSDWVQVRDIEREQPTSSVSKAEHTLKIPIPPKEATHPEYLCLTRIAEERWTLDRNRSDS